MTEPKTSEESKSQPRNSSGLPGPFASLQGSPFFTLLIGAVCVLVAVLTVAGVRAYGDLSEARQLETELEGLVADADLRVTQLETLIERLREDDGALERVAREELGMLFPNEYVVLLPEPAADEPVTSTADAVELTDR